MASRLFQSCAGGTEFSAKERHGAAGKIRFRYHARLTRTLGKFDQLHAGLRPRVRDRALPDGRPRRTSMPEKCNSGSPSSPLSSSARRADSSTSGAA